MNAGICTVRGLLAFLSGVGILILSACTNVATVPKVSLPPLPPLVTSGAEHYVVSADQSRVTFLVHRAGPMAALGHNHVVRAISLRGDVYLNRNYRRSGFQLELPVKAFRVDDPADRATEGQDFSRPVPNSAVAATTHNMRGPKVLDAARFPDVGVRSVAIGGSRSNLEVTIRITLRGVKRDFTVPVEVTETLSRLEARGNFDIRQSDFGITPFSILGGGLRVVDRVEVRFDIVAQRPRTFMRSPMGGK